MNSGALLWIAPKLDKWVMGATDLMIRDHSQCSLAKKHEALERTGFVRTEDQEKLCLSSSKARAMPQDQTQFPAACPSLAGAWGTAASTLARASSRRPFRSRQEAPKVPGVLQSYSCLAGGTPAIDDG